MIAIVLSIFFVTISGITFNGNTQYPTPDTYTTLSDIDVFIWGNTIGALSAQIAAYNANIDTVRASSTGYYGGMTTGGLSAFDIGSDLLNHGGVWKKFCDNCLLWYHNNDPTQETACALGTKVEPKVAYTVLKGMADDAAVNEYDGCKLLSVITSSDKSISEVWIKTSDGTVLKIVAKYYIDASYEQELGQKAGIEYISGREARTTYNEWLAGNIKCYVGRGRSGGTGEASDQIQAYTYRLCLDITGGGTAFPNPDWYDSTEFGYIDDLCSADENADYTDVIQLGSLPNGKKDGNCFNAKIGTDSATYNTYYPTQTKTGWNNIEYEQWQYILRLVYHCKNGANVHQNMKDSWSDITLASDEWTDTDNVPPQLYVREGLRLANPAYMMTQKDIVDPAYLLKSDSVFLGTYMIDCHRCSERDKYSDEAPEGLFINPRLNKRAYQVPFRCLYTPDCPNFMTAFAFGASHVAYCSMRMEPQFCHAGQACAVAASVAIGAGINNIALVSTSDIQTALIGAEQYAQVIEPYDPFTMSDWTPSLNTTITLTSHLPATYGDVSWDFDGNGTVDAENESTITIQFPKNKKYRVAIRGENESQNIDYSYVITAGDISTAEEEYLIDDNEADNTGFTDYYTLVPFQGMGMKTDGNTSKGSCYIEYPITITTADYYDISVSLPQDTSLDTNFDDSVPCELELDNETTYIATWNQQLISRQDRPFWFTCIFAQKYLPVGTHIFRIKNDDTTVKVGADCVKITESGTWEKDNEDVYKWNDYTP